MTVWIVLLLAGGVMLILAEFFLPGLVCGVAGAMMIIGAMTWTALEHPETAVPIITGEAIAVLVALCLGLFTMFRTGGFTGLTLKTAQNVEEGYVNVPTDKALVGKTGAALTPLRPSGTIQVEGRRLDAVTGGVFIEKGGAVLVVEVHGNRIVVEPEPGNEA